MNINPKPDTPIDLPTDPDAETIGSPSTPEALGEQMTEGLIENNRIQIEGIMLPPATDGPLTPGKIADVRDAYRAYLRTNDLSISETAKPIGYSTSTLSEFLGGTYEGDSSAVARQVNTWIERDAQRRMARRPRAIVDTRPYELMNAYIRMADKQNLMLAIVGGSGIGKTRVLEHFRDEFNGVLVSCIAGMTPRDFYGRVCDAMGIHEAKASRMQLFNLIRDKLIGSRKILFVDEAHLLGKHVGCVRPIYDEARVPVVLAGASEILSAIDADRAHGCGQLASRTLRCDLSKLIGQAGSNGRGAPPMLFTKEEIARFFASKRMRITRDGLNMMWQLANLPNRGHLRLIENLADAIFNANASLTAIGRRDVVAALALVAGDMAECLIRDADASFEIESAAAVAKAG